MQIYPVGKGVRNLLKDDLFSKKDDFVSYFGMRSPGGIAVNLRFK
jgi:hypothetical protein